MCIRDSHYNGAGKADAQDYPELADHIGYQKGGVFLLGREYLMPSLAWTASPLLSLSLSSLYNLSDASAFTSVSAAYSLSDEMGLDFGIYIFHGDNLAFTPLPPNLIIQSEYGSNADLAYLSWRYYF